MSRCRHQVLLGTSTPTHLLLHRYVNFELTILLHVQQDVRVEHLITCTKLIFLQQESWRIVSWPDQGDYLLMLWCGRLPVLDYNGGIVLSRKRSDKEMPEAVRNELRQSAKSFGLDFDSFCASDNTECPF